MRVRHYCFLSYGPWGRNPSHLHPRRLGREMLRRGIRVTYVVDDYPQNHAGLDLPDGAGVVFVPDPRGAGQLPARRAIFRKLNPDFVHLRDVWFRSVAALIGPGQPRFVFEWDEARPFIGLPTWRATVEEFLTHWIMRHATHVLVTTRRLQQTTLDKYGRHAAHMPFCVYAEPQPDGPSPFSQPTAVYMGSMHPRWDIDLMWDAIKQLADEGFKPPVALIGNGPDSPWAAKAKADGLTNLLFTGYQDDAGMWNHLRHAHVLLFPIRPTPINETRCPSKTLVYAQARRPVITSRVGEVGEMLGDLGRYVAPTPQAMAAELRRVMQAPRLPDVDYHIEERYNYRDRVDQLLALLES